MDKYWHIQMHLNRETIEKHYDMLGAPQLKKTAVDLFNDIKAFITNPQHLGGDFGVDDLMVGHSYSRHQIYPEI